MKFYIKVNGQCHCESELTYDTKTRCGHQTKESGDADVDKILKAFPGAKVELIEGRCPTYVENERERIERFL